MAHLRVTLPAHGQLYGFGENKFSNVTAGANNDLFDAKDQMIHSATVHENLLLSNNNKGSSSINLLPLHAEFFFFLSLSAQY